MAMSMALAMSIDAVDIHIIYVIIVMYLLIYETRRNNGT